ncbi:aminotransferase class I/II-fold pyridoxal phosphate-dependent enzyme, partial [Streptomyces sp. URMC 123]|uniref:aminotransferase class I/II-fold pyridoxal phosphate-dependent enzyme n=1 Tax=Streptomyces sp. URMC 123 TaxID=3423403 RepID=UPI003F1C114C
MTTSPTRGPDTAGIRRQVVDIVAARTLYDETYLRPESHFEGELGIDSVVLESILASVGDHFGVRPGRPEQLATVQDLVTAVERALGAAGGTAGGAAGGAPDGTASGAADGAPDGESADAGREEAGTRADPLLETIVTTTMRHTHYRRDQLDLDADLEGELGIDSVVLASITADVAETLGLREAAARSVTAGSLRGLRAELAAYVPASGVRAASTGGVRAEPDAVASTAREPAAPPSPEPAGAPVPPDGEPWDDRSMKDFIEQRDPDLFAKARSFRSHLRERERRQLYWYGMPLHSRCENRAVIHDELTGHTREFLMFASNNYLGIANHPKVVDAVCEATRAYGATHTGCRLIGGTNHLHKELERRIAAFKHRPACIVYPGGYAANLGCVSALVKSHDAVVADKLNHMSIVDGAKLSDGVRRIYRHNDMADLERVLERCADQVAGKLVVTDGVFSMHGDICELPEIVTLAERYGARVLVDDAHATGVLGARGTGTAEHFGLTGRVDLELGTMSKALAGMGGFVVGDEDVIEYLRFYSHSYVFAATIPAGVAAGLIAAIDVIESEPERLTRLWSNIRLLRGLLLDAGFDLERTESAILPLVVGDERTALEMGRAVRARGLFCQTVVFPGVPLGDARLRISVTSEHTRQDLEQAAEIFVDAGRETGVLPGRDGAGGVSGVSGTGPGRVRGRCRARGFPGPCPPPRRRRR